MALLTVIRNYMATRGRPRKIPIVIHSPEVVLETIESLNTPIASLSVDYSNEGLNNMARKINEIIEYINAKVPGK